MIIHLIAVKYLKLQIHLNKYQINNEHAKSKN